MKDVGKRVHNELVFIDICEVCNAKTLIRDTDSLIESLKFALDELNSKMDEYYGYSYGEEGLLRIRHAACEVKRVLHEVTVMVDGYEGYAKELTAKRDVLKRVLIDLDFDTSEED